jgi:hypothetical protein
VIGLIVSFLFLTAAGDRRRRGEVVQREEVVPVVREREREY